jgi:protein TonB
VPAARPFPFAPPSRAPKRIGALAALALHAAVGAALISYEPSRQVLLSTVPLMVDLITPPKIEPVPPVEIPPPPPKPKPKVRPKPVIKQPEPPPPVVTAPIEAPTPVEVAPPPPPPPPPPPEPAPIVAPAPPPAPVMVSPPVFTADYLQNPPPSYPMLSRRLGEEGRVVLRVLVNPGGGADEVQIRTSSGHERLDDAARETVRRWRFVPATRGEQPVAAWVLIPISFRLEG